MLNRVQFKNIRALADLTLDLGRLTVLVGKNACGKSTVLDEIERLCEMSRPEASRRATLGPAGWVLQQEGIPPQTTGGTGSQAWRGEQGDTYYEVEIAAADARLWFQRLSCLAKTAASSSLLYWEGEAGPSAEKQLEFEHILTSSFAWRVQRLSLERRMILQASPPDSPLDALEPSGFGLPTLLLHLAANAPDAYAAIQRDLACVVPHFRRLYVKKLDIKDFAGQRSAYALDLVFEGAGRIPAEMASEGTLFALGLLTALHAPELPNIILLDDLDRGLHLSAQYEIIQAIRRVLATRPDVQVICTSHAPVLVDSFDAEEVRVLALDKAGHTIARPLTALPDFKRWAGALTPGELWANFGEEWVLSDG